MVCNNYMLDSKLLHVVFLRVGLCVHAYVCVLLLMFVRACVGVHSCVRIMCLYVCECVCVCGCIRARVQLHVRGNLLVAFCIVNKRNEA